MPTRRALKRLGLFTAVLAILSTALVGTVAYLTARANETVTFTVAQFAKDGYALERTAPSDYFTAGESVTATIKESNTESSDFTAQLTMSAHWESPDPDTLLWDKAVLKLDNHPISFITHEDGTISFQLDEITLAGGASRERELTLVLPADLKGTGTVTFAFDKAEVKGTKTTWTKEYSREELNSQEDLSYAVPVAWNISKNQSTKDLIAYLTGSPGQYRLEIIKNGQANNTNYSRMQDFSLDKSAGAGDLTKWRSSAPWYGYRSEITDVSMPDVLGSIGDGAFLNLSSWSVSHLTIPGNVSSIGEAAFGNVSAITEVTIPKSVTVIESQAFGALPNAHTFTFAHGISDALCLPDNDSGNGAFHLGSPYSQANPRATKVVYVNDTVRDYHWGADNRGYRITVENSTGGTLLATPTVAIQGQEINLSAKPEGDYKYSGATYICEDEGGLEQTKTLGKNELSFTMPESSVTLTPKWLAPPMLAPQQSWYDMADANGDLYPEEVRKIVLVDQYTPTGYEWYSWDASDPSVPGTVTGYLVWSDTEGVSVVLSGNGYGKIFANPDSKCAFGNMQDGGDYAEFTHLYEIANLDLLDTSKVTTMENMFAWLPQLTELDLSHFVTDKVTNMRSMFERSSGLADLDLSSFNTSLVGDMSYMFSDCESLPALNISNFNTSKVTDMSGMFRGCQSLSSLDLSHFNTGAATSMSEMFWLCETLTSLDISNFNTGLVEDMLYMFADCSSLPALDVTSFDTSNVTTMLGMFKDCTSLESIDVSDFNTAKVTEMSDMFQGCSSLTSLDLSSFNTAEVTGMMNMFSGCTNLTNVDVSSFNTGKTISFASMFNKCENLEILDLSSFDSSSLHSSGMNYMFRNMYKLDTVILGPAFQFTSSSYARLPSPSSTYITGATGNWYSTDEWVKYTAAKVASSHGSKTVTYTAYPPALNSISITKAPVKVDYAVGETFDPSGMVVQAKYTHKAYPSFTKTLADNDYTIPNGADLPEDATSVTVSYTDKYYSTASSGVTKTAQQPITVKAAAVEPMLASSRSWYKGTITRNMVSQIDIVDSYDITGKTIVEQWDASDASVPGTVTAYLEDDGLGNGTYKLTIAGNGCGKIYTNPNSAYAFSQSRSSSGTTGLFLNATAINGLALLDTSRTTDMREMFRNCTKVTDFDISNWDVSQVTRTDYMFDDCYSTPSLDLDNWNVENVTNMSYMFAGGSSSDALKHLGVSNWNPKNVTNFSGFLSYRLNLETADFSKWDTGSATNLTQMFSNCRKLAAIDVSNWDVKNVTTMKQTFLNCLAITELSVGKWDVGSVKDFSETFGACKILASLDVSNWDTSSATTLSGTFSACGDLTFLDISGWNTSKVTNTSFLFSSYNKSMSTTKTMALQTLDVSKWDMHLVTDASSMFRGCTKLTALDVSKWNTGNVKNFANTFEQCSSLAALDVSNWDTSNATNLTSTFYNCSKVSALDVSDWIVDNVTTMVSTFQNVGVSSLDVSRWNVGAVTSMRQLFMSSNELAQVDVSNWNTGKVTNLSSMFQGCSSLTALNFASWNTSKVTTFSDMFEGCSALTALDLSMFTSESVTRTSEMFYQCSKLTSVDISGMNITALSSSSTLDMFTGCTAGVKIYVGSTAMQSHVVALTRFPSSGAVYVKAAAVDIMPAQLEDEEVPVLPEQELSASVQLPDGSISSAPVSDDEFPVLEGDTQATNPPATDKYFSDQDEPTLIASESNPIPSDPMEEQTPDVTQDEPIIQENPDFVIE